MILKPRISGDIRYKRSWELLGALLGIGLGIPIYLITSLIPGFSTDFIYNVFMWQIPDLLGGIDPMLSALPPILRGVMSNINDVSLANPYFPLSILFISFIEFPHCLVWIVPGILIGYNRNKQFYNVEIKNNGWKVFWHGAFFIQLAMMIMAVILGLSFIMQFLPGVGTNEIIFAYFGGGLFKLLSFFASPFFWLGLLFAGLGGKIGSKIAMKKVSPSEVVIEEVEAAKVFEEEAMLMEKEMEAFEGEEMIWPEAAKASSGESELDVKSVKEKIKATSETDAKMYATTTADTIKCSKCGKALPVGAKFCNNCGNKLL